MLRITLLLVISCLLLSSKSIHFTAVEKRFTKEYVHIPAEASGQDFYMSSVEVTNRQYHEFINALIASGKTEQLKVAMVDTMKWNTALMTVNPYVSYYFQHPAYDDYPVVNISKEAAQLYCQWLTEQYNAQSTSKVHFALPTEAQWCYAARAGQATAIYPWAGDSITYQRKGPYYQTYLCNFRKTSTEVKPTSEQKTIDVTAPSHSYMPNKFGVYNMSGNVAELLADRDYVVGGSWYSTVDKVKIGGHESVSLPSPMVGFRPVMVVESR